MVECPADWKYCAIGKLACLKAGNDHFETSQCDGIYPWYGGNGVRGYSSCFTYDGLFPIVGRQGELCGNVKLAKGRFSATEHAVVVACGPEVLPNYFYYSLTFANLNQYATGCAQPGLSVQKICGVQILTPTLPEQRRIAAALGDMDKLIDNLSKRIEKKKAIKQGTVQELFTGMKRLSGFGGEWIEYRLGELVNVFDGTHQTPNYVDIGIPFYSVENIMSGDFVHVKQISICEHHLLTKASKIERGDVLMTRIGSIGVCKYIDWEVDASFYVSLALLKNRNKSICDMKFLAQLSHYSGFKKEIMSHSLEFATPMKINKGEINKVRIKIPPTLAEQQAIAKVLSGMDAEIANLERKLEKLKFLKQGMMQDLLTGKVRLK